MDSSSGTIPVGEPAAKSKEFGGIGIGDGGKECLSSTHTFERLQPRKQRFVRMSLCVDPLVAEPSALTLVLVWC